MSLNDINRLRTNLLSQKTQTAIAKQSKMLQKSLQRLYTGSRIPRAEDDAASFSLSAKLRARIKGLEQAEQNILDARSMIAIMSNSMDKMVELLVNIKQQILQAANAVSGTEERELIRKTINGYASEINQIVSQTTYNGKQLLAEDFSATFQVGERTSQTLSIGIPLNLNAQDLQVERITSLGIFTSSGTITTGTRLNDLDQFNNIQAGDTFDLVLTSGDGTTETLSVTAPGSKGQATNYTVGDLINRINSSSNFTASFNSTDQAIEVIETTVTEGNALSLSIGNFNEFPGTDGATSSLSFAFDNASGSIKGNLSGAAVNTGTNLNSFSQFSNLEGQDTLSISLRDRSGNTVSVGITMAGAEGQATSSTLNDVILAINAQSGGKFSASVTGGQLTIEELSLAQNALTASATYTENNLDIGAASVSTVSFTQKPELVAMAGISGITGTTRLDDAGQGIGNGFTAGEQFDINLTNNDGTNTTLTYTFGSPADTYQDLINYINANSNFTAAISGGELVLSEDNRTSGTSLGGSLNGYTGSGTFNNQTINVVRDVSATSEGSFGAINTGTVLNNMAQFTNVQVGDTLELQITDNSGANQNVTFTFAGNEGEAASSTIQNLINAINTTSLTASYDAGLSSIIIEDGGTTGTSLSFSFSNAGFTEDPKPNNGAINLSFGYNGTIEGMESNQMTTGGGGSNVAAGTRLSDIDGWGTIEGQDVIQINLSNRAGNNQTFNFNINDVAEGTATNLTVGDLVNFIDSQSVGGVQMSATLSNGRIQITEDNPPQTNGFSAASSFTENNIDRLPKQFTNSTFDIKDFLGLDTDTGLVIGMGLLDFDSGTTLTQSTATKLVENIEDSIGRVVQTSNDLGIALNQMDNRQRFVSRSIISNEAARSRMADVNYANEYSKYVKNQIIQQYQLAASVQANLSPQYLLALL